MRHVGKGHDVPVLGDEVPDFPLSCGGANGTDGRPEGDRLAGCHWTGWLQGTLPLYAVFGNAHRTLGISCETRVNDARLGGGATSKITGFRQLHALVVRPCVTRIRQTPIGETPVQPRVSCRAMK